MDLRQIMLKNLKKQVTKKTASTKGNEPEVFEDDFSGEEMPQEGFAKRKSTVTAAYLRSERRRKMRKFAAGNEQNQQARNYLEGFIDGIQGRKHDEHPGDDEEYQQGMYDGSSLEKKINSSASIDSILDLIVDISNYIKDIGGRDEDLENF